MGDAKVNIDCSASSFTGSMVKSNVPFSIQWYSTGGSSARPGGIIAVAYQSITMIQIRFANFSIRNAAILIASKNSKGSAFF
jgi:hypothetical protein